MSAWDLYDDLIDAIPRDIVVSRAAQNPRWTRVYTESPSCGVAMTMSATSRPAQMSAEYSGVPLRALAQLAKSWNFSEASFGMALRLPMPPGPTSSIPSAKPSRVRRSPSLATSLLRLRRSTRRRIFIC